MNIHKNARLTPLRREEMALSVIEGAFFKAHAARAYGVSAKIVARRVERYKAEGRAGTVDRSSRPAHMPQATAASIAERIVALRRQRWTGKHIAHEVGVSPATVSRVLKRAGLSRLKDIEPAEPVRRYEREHPGEMIHTSRSSAVLSASAIALPANVPAMPVRAAAVGSSSMFASTTPPASPFHRSCPTRNRRAPSPSSRRRWPTTPASASR